MQFAVSWYLKILSSQGSYTQKLASVSVMNLQDGMIDTLGGAWVETRKEKCYGMDQRTSCCHSRCLPPLCHQQRISRSPLPRTEKTSCVSSSASCALCWKVFFTACLVLAFKLPQLNSHRVLKIEAENTKFLLPHSVAQASLTVTILVSRLSFYRCPLRHLTPHATHIFLCYGKRLREEVAWPQPPSWLVFAAFGLNTSSKIKGDGAGS